MIVLDASVLIAQFESTDANSERALELLSQAGIEDFGASPVTIAEILVSPTRKGRLAEAHGQLRALSVSEVPIGPNLAVRLAQLRAETKLKMPDCFVLLAAEDCQASAVLTLDDRLRAQATRLGFESPAVQP